MTPEQPPEPHVHPTPFAALAVWGIVGLVGGWALRPLSQRYADSSPLVSWFQVFSFVLVAAILGCTAWITHRAISRSDYIEPRRAVNLLVLAKACALVGALAAGGYAGYAIGWIDQPAQLAGERMLHSGLASLAGIAMCVTALLLERACRVPDGGDAA